MRNWQAFWLTVGAMTFAAFASWFAQRTPTTSGEVAAWVQAVGSVAAIVAAVLIARRDRTRTEQRATVGAFNAAAAALAFSTKIIIDADRMTQERSWRPALVELKRRQLVSARAMLERITISDMPGEVSAAKMLNGFRLLHLAETALVLVEEKMGEGVDYPQDAFGRIVTDLAEQYEGMGTAARQWLHKKGW